MAAATLPDAVRLRRVHPRADEIAPLTRDGRDTLLDWYRLDSPTHLRLTVISTLDGRAAGADGTSESLTSPIDRTVLGVIRELSDVVLVGAETLRREPRLVPRDRPLAVLSGSGQLSGPVGSGRATAPLAPPRVPVLVVTTASGAERVAVEHPWAETITLDATDGRIALPTVLDTLRARGLRRIAAEGGPALAAALVSEGLVDELCLTLAPRLGGSALPVLRLPSATAADATDESGSTTRLDQLLIDDSGALYGRWRLTTS